MAIISIDGKDYKIQNAVADIFEAQRVDIKQLEVHWEECQTEYNKLNNRRFELEAMFDEVLDAHYGTAIHHIGDGDGIADARAHQIRAYWHNRLEDKGEPR